MRPSAPRSSATTATASPSTTSCAREPTGWKAYDVNIDGISYVKSYREDFGAQIDQKGIER